MTRVPGQHIPNCFEDDGCNFGDIIFTDDDGDLPSLAGNSFLEEPGHEPLENLTGMDIIAMNFGSESCTKEPDKIDTRHVPPFLIRLHKILSDDSYANYIEWKGGEILVTDPVGFEMNVLPLHFNHSNFCSFSRQMNHYGFRKISGGSVMASCVFRNHMITGDMLSLYHIKRRKTVRGKKTKRGAEKPTAVKMQKVEKMANPSDYEFPYHGTQSIFSFNGGSNKNMMFPSTFKQPVANVQDPEVLSDFISTSDSLNTRNPHPFVQNEMNCKKNPSGLSTSEINHIPNHNVTKPRHFVCVGGGPKDNMLPFHLGDSWCNPQAFSANEFSIALRDDALNEKNTSVEGNPGFETGNMLTRTQIGITRTLQPFVQDKLHQISADQSNLFLCNGANTFSASMLNDMPSVAAKSSYVDIDGGSIDIGPTNLIGIPSYPMPIDKSTNHVDCSNSFSNDVSNTVNSDPTRPTFSNKVTGFPASTMCYGNNMIVESPCATMQIQTADGCGVSNSGQPFNCSLNSSKCIPRSTSTSDHEIVSKRIMPSRVTNDEEPMFNAFQQWFLEWSRP